MHKELEDINTLSLYSTDIRVNGYDKLLTRLEEQELGRTIQGGLKRIDLQKPVNIDNVDLTSDAKEAFGTLVNHNLRLVRAVAARFFPILGNQSDNEQYGYLGLVNAALKYNPERECKFSTYATYWIRQNIRRSIMNNENTIRIPIHVMEVMLRARKFSNEFTNSKGREPQFDELVEIANLSKVDSLRLKSGQMQIFELDRPVNDEKSSFELGKIVKDKQALNPEEQFIKKELYTTLLSTIEKVCTKEEKEIVYEFYGLLNGGKKTHKEIARKKGVTRQRISQIKMRAMRKITKAMYVYYPEDIPFTS